MDTKILLAMVMLLFVVLFVGAKAQSAAPPVSPHDEGMPIAALPRLPASSASIYLCAAM